METLIATRHLNAADSPRRSAHLRHLLHRLTTLTVALVLGLAPQTLCIQEVNAESSERPNIVLIMADDLGWGDTGYNGHSKLRTPHLDRMASEGIRFDRFYSGAPVCSPTRGSCLTGRHPYRYGVVSANAGYMKPRERTLAEALKANGYVTGHFGKWHLGTLTTKIKDSNRGRPGKSEHYSPPWENGFDVCFSTEAKTPTWDPMKVPTSFREGNKRIGWPALEPNQPFEHYGTHYWVGPEQQAKSNLDGDDSRVIVDRAAPFIEKAAADDKPFFAVIWFHTPHLPVVAGPEYAQLYADESLHARNYYGCITAMDEQIGRVRETLKRAGVEENTMVWFCADNGPEGNSKSPGTTKGLRGRKRSLYEGGIRVPGLLVWPKVISAARTVSVPCSTSDYFPTVLEVLGKSDELVDRPYDGVSLMPIIQGRTTTRPKPIGFQSAGQVALIDNRFKLYRGKNRTADELYDLQADPAEQSNLADRHPDVVQTMAASLEQWRRSCRQSLQGEDY